MGVWLGGRGEGAGRGIPSRRGPGAWAPKIVLKISIDNLRFKGYIHAVFYVFLNIILHYIIPKRHLVTMKTRVKYGEHIACNLQPCACKYCLLVESDCSKLMNCKIYGLSMSEVEAGGVVADTTNDIITIITHNH
jgi:hypothetical protein